MYKKELIRFFGLSLLLYIGWYLTYELWIGPDGRVDSWLNEVVAYSSYRLLNIFGYDSCITNTSVCVRNVSTVTVGNGCNGLEIYAIFTGFIIVMHGRWKYKLLFIVVGLLSIFVLNVFRVTMLAIDRYNDLNIFRFNHKYTYVFVIYSFIFMLWIIWIKKYADKKAVA
ncbi:MAG: archaeosortase/exosortase family protein [Cytophagales bacterium]|nr:archaeosortase/exosortase family protein [Cytophagales bacterium]